MTSEVNENNTALKKVNIFLQKCEILVKNFQGGQISKHIKNWKEITSDQNILCIVSGDHIQFSETPPIKHTSVNPVTSEEKAYVHAQVNKLHKKGVIQRTVHEKVEYISPIFITPKSDGDFRLILNLKNLNNFIEFQHFKMHTIKDVLQLVNKDCFMTSIDLKDAYYSVKMNPKFHCYLKFKIDGELWQYVCYPNGLGPCPRKFTKLTVVPMSEIRKHGIPICGYIDDFILTGKTFNSALEGTLWSAELFLKLGFVVHPVKSQLVPSQTITFLGFVIDSVSMTISLTEKRRHILRDLLLTLARLKNPTIRFLAKVIGHIISVMPASRYGALHYRKLELDKTIALRNNFGNFDAKMTLSNHSLNDLNWWLENSLSIQNWIHPPPIDVEISTDASKHAWGVVFTEKIGGSWTETEIDLHINIKEMIAIYFALKAFCSQLKGRHVKILCDNTTAIGVLNKMGSSQSEACDDLCQKIWEHCKLNGIWITCTYIPGKCNVEADTESRRDYRDGNWMLNKKLFKNVCARLTFQPDIDCFANRINAQLPRYISYKPDPDAFLINAFSHNWSKFKGYMFPPFSLVGRVLQKVKVDQATVLLIAPEWPSQHWYTMLMEMLVMEPVRLSPCQQNLVLPTDLSEVHPLWRKLTLLACLVSGKT